MRDSNILGLHDFVCHRSTSSVYVQIGGVALLGRESLGGQFYFNVISACSLYAHWYVRVDWTSITQAQCCENTCMHFIAFRN